MNDVDQDHLDMLECELCGDIITPRLRQDVARLVQLARAVVDAYDGDGVFAPRIDNALRRWRRDRSVR